MESELNLREWFAARVSNASGSVWTTIYDLPEQLFAVETGTAVSPVVQETPKPVVVSTGGLTCRTCGLTFLERPEQLRHFKSDFHVANIKRKMDGLESIPLSDWEAQPSQTVATKPVPEETVEEREEQEADSDSSEAPDSPESEDDDQTLANTYSDTHGQVSKQCSHQFGPQFVIIKHSFSPFSFSLSLALFPAISPLAQRHWAYEPQFWSVLQQEVRRVRENGLMAVFALRSGRFAAAVFDNHRTTRPLLLHKVIRRYTVRAKAGGGQSSHDKKHGKANSMGAQLRRHGEQQLKEDIARLLTTWHDQLSSCSLILIAATKTMRAQLFEKPTERSDLLPGQPIEMLSRDDKRIVYVPFTVEQPTLEAVQSIRDRCLAVKLMDLSKTAAQSAETSVQDDISSSTAQFTTSVVQTNIQPASVSRQSSSSSTLELENDPIAQQILDVCASASDSEAVVQVTRLLSSLVPLPVPPSTGTNNDEDEDEVNPNIPSEELKQLLRAVNNLTDLSTALHISTARSLVQTAHCLLLAGASPEALDSHGRTPYYLATSKEMRDCFRRARAQLGEDCWDWKRAGVPEALSDERLAQQRQKEREKKKRAQQRKKEQKQKEQQEREDAELALKLQQEMEEQMKAEEAQRRQQAAGTCTVCQKSLFGIKNVVVSQGHRLCSETCSLQLRRHLAAQAALARLQTKG